MVVQCCCKSCGKRHQSDEPKMQHEEEVFGYVQRMCAECFALHPADRVILMQLRAKRLSGKKLTEKQRDWLKKKGWEV